MPLAHPDLLVLLVPIVVLVDLVDLLVLYILYILLDLYQRQHLGLHHHLEVLYLQQQLY